jgi:hypothetical protein
VTRVGVVNVAARAAAWGAAVVVAATPLPAGAAAPGEQSGCDEVTVMVDYDDLGGEPLLRCAGAGSAAEAFDEAGVRLDFLPQQPGFVCRVDGLPDGGPCFEGDAYWSLWWSDGSEEWTYATLGVTSLEIPAGGAVAFAWHEGAGDATPPGLEVPAAAAGGDADHSAGDGADEGSDDGSFPVWAAGGIAVLVLGAAAVPLLRRRREEAA